jgi:hypothetical protein
MVEISISIRTAPIGTFATRRSTDPNRPDRPAPHGNAGGTGDKQIEIVPTDGHFLLPFGRAEPDNPATPLASLSTSQH